MTLITLAEAKAYLRVDTADEDGVIIGLLSAAARLCADVARLTNEQWMAIDSDQEDEALTPVRETIRVAILYALGYVRDGGSSSCGPSCGGRTRRCTRRPGASRCRS